MPEQAEHGRPVFPAEEERGVEVARSTPPISALPNDEAERLLIPDDEASERVPAP